MWCLRFVPAVLVLVAAWIDWRSYRIPNKLVAALALWWLVLWRWAPHHLVMIDRTLSPLHQAACGVLTMGVLLASVWVFWRLRQGRHGPTLTQAGLGFGDIKLCLACALYLSGPQVAGFLALAGASTVALWLIRWGLPPKGSESGATTSLCVELLELKTENSAAQKPGAKNPQPARGDTDQRESLVMPFGPALALSFWVFWGVWPLWKLA